MVTEYNRDCLKPFINNNRQGKGSGKEEEGEIKENKEVKDPDVWLVIRSSIPLKMVVTVGFVGRNGQKRVGVTGARKYARHKLRGKIKNPLTEFKESVRIRKVKG